MATREEGADSNLPPGAMVIPDDEADLVDLDQWLELVASDESVQLPRPAAEHLHEAREC